MYNRTDKNIVARKHRIVGTVIKVNGRTVGQVIGNEYVKDICNRHMLTTPPAIANDVQALHDAERAGAEYCDFTNTETGIIYRVSIAKIWDMGKAINFGWGDQIYLTLQNWTQARDPNHSSTDTVTPAYTEDGTTDTMPLTYKSHAITGTQFTKGAAKQLRLFGNGGNYG